MRVLACAAGLISAIIIMAPTSADAKKAKKAKNSPQVAGFLQVSSNSSNGGLLRAHERGRAYDRVNGNDNVAKFFNMRTYGGGT
jgi:hypothetical protein